MPLSIAYFDADGRLISTADMKPCADTPHCPDYPADHPFTYALEVPKGMLESIKVTGKAHLVLHVEDCPVAKAS